MRLFDLIEGLALEVRGARLAHRAACEIIDVVTDTAQASETTIFVCTRTALHDGHTRAYAAYSAGCRVFVAARGLGLPDDATVLVSEDCNEALAMLAARCYGHPARRLCVFGITGSAGKTSVAYLLAHVLRCSHRRVAVITDEGITVDGVHTPPDAIVPDAADLQRHLRNFANAGVECVVLEFSAYQLSQKVAFCIPFTAVLLTNFRENQPVESALRATPAYRTAKQSLLMADAAFAVVPTEQASFLTRGQRVTYGDGGDFTARDAYVDEALVTHMTLCEGADKIQISMPVARDIAVENALAAMALARIAGCSTEEIGRFLSEPIETGRMERICRYRERTVFVDSAYTADGVVHALEQLRRVCRGRLSVLLGAVGGRARSRRAPLARAAVRFADFVYFTADNPDYESPEEICAELASYVTGAGNYTVIPDRRAAITRAVHEMRPGDILLLAGKGNESYQLIFGRREPFSEREITKEAMAMR